MGCDFYTYYVIRIEYKKYDKIKVESQVIEETRERHYFLEVDGRDEDFEELDDYYERLHSARENQINREVFKYKRKDIYKNNKWLCISSSKEKYINICNELEINENDVISIWKEGDFHYR